MGDISDIQRPRFLPRRSEAGGPGCEQEQELHPASDVKTAPLREVTQINRGQGRDVPTATTQQPTRPS